jgi:hypothetical protein
MKVILYFFVAGVNFVSSMYGFLPPIFAPSFETRKLAGLKAAARYKCKTEIKKTCHPEGWRYKNQIQRRRPEASGTRN